MYKVAIFTKKRLKREEQCLVFFCFDFKQAVKPVNKFKVAYFNPRDKVLFDGNRAMRLKPRTKIEELSQFMENSEHEVELHTDSDYQLMSPANLLNHNMIRYFDFDDLNTASSNFNKILPLKHRNLINTVL